MIILRRNKKNVELYPIGPAKGALNNERNPLFYSYFKLQENNGKIRPYRFIIQQDNVELLKSPKEVIRILRKQNVLLATKDEDIEKMLKALDISKSELIEIGYDEDGSKNLLDIADKINQ